MKAYELASGVLRALSEAKEARGMISVVNAHVSGISYMNLGDYGLEFLEDLAATGERVRVPTSSNPCGMDRELWREQGISEDFAAKQARVNAALEKMGIAPTYSCTFPYEGQWSSKLKPGDHVAWAESSAVVYGNSVLGLRSNREGGPSALFSGITGLTPNYGMHLDENRKPTVLIKVEQPIPRGPLEWGLLGKKIAELGEKAKVPYIYGLGRIATKGELKALSAALATFGPTDMFLAPYLSPEASKEPPKLEEVTIDGRELEEQSREALDKAVSGETPKAFFLGCPQYGVEELVYIARLLSDVKKVKGDIFIYTSRHAISDQAGFQAVNSLREKGVKVFRDTCPVFSPAPSFSGGVMTDSVKSSFYMPQSKSIRPTLEPTVASFMLASGELEGKRLTTYIGKAVVAGTASGEAIVSYKPLSFLGGINPSTGIVIDEESELKGESVKGKVLVYPTGKGSTVGSYIIYAMKKMGTSPAAIIMREADTVTIIGCVLAGIPLVHRVNPDPLEIKAGSMVRVADGTIEVTDR
ncbi:aconitase X [Tardisphaera saccharovorans]